MLVFVLFPSNAKDILLCLSDLHFLGSQSRLKCRGDRLCGFDKVRDLMKAGNVSSESSSVIMLLSSLVGWLCCSMLEAQASHWWRLSSRMEGVAGRPSD